MFKSFNSDKSILFTQQQEGEGVSRGRQVKAALLIKLKHGALGGGHQSRRGAVGALPGEAAQNIILLESMGNI